VRASKGPERPVVGEAERAELVDGLGVVDLVVFFGEPRADAVITALRPDLHVKGTDYTAQTVPERELVRSLGGETIIAGDPKEHSTTAVVARLAALGGAGRAR
jgi:bifunctional ADP-heptose synthase (sugar kinase/adenylyltransferase)